MTENKTRRPRRTYTDEFKNQLVQLHLNGKRKCDIIREYDISGTLLDKWIKQSTTTGSFREKDNRSEMEQKLIDLRKRIFRESRNNYGTRKIKNVEFALVDNRKKSTKVLINRDVLSKLGYVINPAEKHTLDKNNI